MNITFARKVPWKMAFYVAFVLYLLTDLYWCSGPLRSSLNNRLDQEGLSDQALLENKAVAKVYGEVISSDQLETRLREDLFIKGKTIGSLNEAELKSAKLVTLAGMIDDALIRLQARVNDLRRPVNEDLVQEEYESFKSRFPSEAAFLSALAGQGIDAVTLRQQIAARHQQELQIRSVLDEVIVPSDEDIAASYAVLKESYDETGGESRPVSHIFLSILHKDKDIVRNEADLMLARLNEGMTFEALAKEKSEDARTAKKGGDLGLISLDRSLSGEFEKKVMSLPIDTPEIVETPLGYHVVKAGPKQKMPFPRSEELREHIRSTLMSQRRAQALELYLERLRAEARASNRITVFTDRL